MALITHFGGFFNNFDADAKSFQCCLYLRRDDLSCVWNVFNHTTVRCKVSRYHARLRAQTTADSCTRPYAHIYTVDEHFSGDTQVNKEFSFGAFNFRNTGVPFSSFLLCYKAHARAVWIFFTCCVVLFTFNIEQCNWHVFNSSGFSHPKSWLTFPPNSRYRLNFDRGISVALSVFIHFLLLIAFVNST